MAVIENLASPIACFEGGNIDRMLNRTTRRVGLTQVGSEYYARCSQILHELAEADEVASALQATPRGRLRVYCQQGLGRFIAPMATQFLREYSDVSLDLLTGDTMIDLVHEGFDLAIMPVSPPDSKSDTTNPG